MILRKPYAILIKNFKLIHLVLTLMMIYLFIQTSSLLTFFNDNISGQDIIQGYDISRELFNSWTFILPIIIVLASFTILSLMFFKKKPFLIYVINIISYISLGILYYITLTNVDILEVRLVDIRVLRAIRDFLIGAMVIQSFTTIFMFVRATGFDIKKFNFTEDLDELEISEEDREEFELELDFDADKLIRTYRRKLRTLKYGYLENKFIINIFILVFSIGFITYTLVDVFVLNRAYNEKVLFETENYFIKVNNTYITQQNFKSEKIFEKTKLVIIDLDIRNTYAVSSRLDTVLTELVIGKKYFRPINKYDELVFDIGKSYNKEPLSTNISNFILVYEVPIELSLEKAYFNYKETLLQTNRAVTKNYKVKINPINLDENIITKQIDFGQEIDLSETILKSGKFKIDHIQFSDVFVSVYNHCINGECSESFEYILPSYTGKEDKSLVYIEASYKNDKITNFSNFANYYFDFQNEDFTNDIPMKRIIPKVKKSKEYYIFEVNSKILEQEEFTLKIRIRNKIFNVNTKLEIVNYI